MFDHLDTLDDATPPTPDGSMLGRVHGRADRLRRRTRGSAIAAGVAVLAVAAGVAAVTRDQKHSVSVITPGTTATSTSTTSRAANGHSFVVGTLPNGLSVRMNLATETVQLGDDIHVEAVVTNNTFKTQTIGRGPIQCVLELGLVLRDAQGNDVADGRENVGCDDVGRSLARNQTVTVSASLPTPSVRLAAGARQGRFELRLEDERRLPRDPPAAGSIGPIPIFVRAPDVTARLILPVTSARSGDEIKGTLVLDNLDSEPVTYQSGCDGGDPWSVMLGENGAAFPIAVPQGPCAMEARQLPPGTSRFPFRAQLRNRSCAETAIPSIHTPKCDNGIPPLAPGGYQLMFRDNGVFRTLAVPPVAITVHG